MSAHITELYAPAADVAPWRREARARRYDRVINRALEILIDDCDLLSATVLAMSADRVHDAQWAEPDYEWLGALYHELLRWHGIDRRAIAELLVAAQARLGVEQRSRHAEVERQIATEEARDGLH